MRSIFHEILARYLATDQHAFETSPRELWPVPSTEASRNTAEGRSGQASEQASCQRVYGELEPQN